MKEINTVLTRKGQTTIPVEIRRALGLKEGDRITFILDADKVSVQRAGSVVARTAGACRSARPALSVEQLREAAERAIADETRERQGT
jgi:antitoxin PrlF